MRVPFALNSDIQTARAPPGSEGVVVISSHAPPCEPSPPLHYDVGRESRALSLCGHGARPSHGVQRRSVWPLRRDGEQRAYDVLMPSCDVRLLSST
jgi:hypothetical protein